VPNAPRQISTGKRDSRHDCFPCHNNASVSKLPRAEGVDHPYSARAALRVMPNPAATFTTTVKVATSERAVPHTKGGAAWG